MTEQRQSNLLIKVLKWIACFVFAVLLLFPEFIANEKPIICSENDQLKYPALQDWTNHVFGTNREIKEVLIESGKCKPILSSPIGYSASYIPSNIPSFRPPGFKDTTHDQDVHLLGTDKLGRDVAAGLIYGLRTACMVGLISVLISLIIGVFLGVLAGYYGDHTMRFTLMDLVFMIGLTPIAIFYGFGLIDLEYEGLKQWIHVFRGIAIMTLILGGGIFLSSKLNKWTGLNSKRFYLPLDMIVSRLIEIFNSIPGLFILLALLAVFRRPSIWNVIFIIGLIRWPGIARLLRAELLRIKKDEYIDAARASGFSNLRIILRHALPNAMNPILVALAFGVSVAILLESTLSFLGIGLAPEDISWGILLSQARENLSAWWLAVFPGLAIFLAVLYFNYLGDRIARIGD